YPAEGRLQRRIYVGDALEEPARQDARQQDVTCRTDKSDRQGMTNPYAGFLAGADPLDVLPTTAGRLRGYLDRLGSARVEQKPAPGKWSVREVFCHLADTEIVFAFRLRQALAEPHHVIQPFEQDDWAKTYSAFGATSALAVFETVRQWNL